YRDNGIDLRLGCKVVDIDRENREVTRSDGSHAQYDRLLVATGSSPFILPIPGKDLQGVIGYRDIADTRAMMETARSHRHALVIGGGLLGLEAANGLRLRGMEVTVVHLGDWLLDRQLDRTAGKLLQNAGGTRASRFRLNTNTAPCSTMPGRVASAHFSDGEECPADLVVMRAGIRPNVELAERAGLECDRGIRVD
nr:nitrite reductase apoenzyme, NasA [Azotobacter vinelandii, Peptide Partial, 195 aa] [Azotobacter vinelandii]